MTPRIGVPSNRRLIKVQKVGFPEIKLDVPSIGSMTQVYWDLVLA
jgi:hypothetical protein